MKMKDIQDIIDRCEMTAAWEGVSIQSLDQRNMLGDTPLHTVCSWREPEAVKRLIAVGAKVNATGDKGCTPLFNAVIGGSPEIIGLLLAAGADRSIRSELGWSPVEYAKRIGASDVIIGMLMTKQSKRHH
jgi:ankyrin repeat protein